MAHSTRRTPTTVEGVVSGYLLKLCRAAARLDQQRLAERVGVGVTTIQGWESGRSPLPAVQVARYTALRHHLRHAGTPPALLDTLQVALDVDYLIGHATEHGSTAPASDTHPLATWVMPKTAADLFVWALGGDPPPTGPLAAARPPRRYGPTPTGPRLPAAQRTQIINHLRWVTDQTATREQEPQRLLWRQALYLLSGHHHDPAALRRRARGQTTNTRHPSAAVLTTARSVAIALARHGDPDWLRWFIDRTSGDDHAERVNLAYWAYWVGELPGPRYGDHFMADTDPAAFGGATLLGHHIDRLRPDLGYLDLTAHTLWSLIAAKPHLLTEHPATARLLSERAGVILDHRDQLSPRAHQEITQVRYALQLAGHPNP